MESTIAQMSQKGSAVVIVLENMKRESQLVESDHDGSSQADVVLQGHFGPRDLSPVRLPPELPAQLCTLGQAYGQRGQRDSSVQADDDLHGC
ncbi:hypothetical protein EYF80_008287 [Liparis tanakae]|uniref:Uncharacterized protein n=1 Tax=Liparis tanakae TaxID=230148 RepID=A0A4Z2IUC1_9TELE|nr:hypothetical protein EYF80_008287 [Liparis tanakae]